MEEERQKEEALERENAWELKQENSSETPITEVPKKNETPIQN